MLGAAGLGDIGERFPDTDPALAGADSIELLRLVAGAVEEEGWMLGNADCSVICVEPKLAPGAGGDADVACPPRRVARSP